MVGALADKSDDRASKLLKKSNLLEQDTLFGKSAPCFVSA